MEECTDPKFDIHVETRYVDPADYPNIERPSIWFLFYKQNEESQKSIWNRLTQCWTGSPYIHTEFFFPLTCASVSITSTQPVTITGSKPYYAHTYDAIAIDVTWEQYNTMWKRCTLEQGKTFDKSARLYFGFSWLLARDVYDEEVPEHWICSKLMAFCAREAKIFPSSVIIGDIHPGALKMLLDDVYYEPEYRYRNVSLAGDVYQ